MNSTEIKNSLRSLGDPAIAAHSQRFFKTSKGEYGEGDRFLGIRVPVLRKVAKHYRDTPLREITRLLKSPYHEERLTALFMLVQRFVNSTDKERASIYELYLMHTKYINNWDLVDGSAPQIVGAYLAEKHKKPLYDLVESNSLWERRIGLMSTFTFIKDNDFKDALKLSEALLTDKEDLMHKAVGWMLREIGNRNRSVEELFLVKNYKKMPTTMLRYSIEKFPEKERQQYLKGLK